MKKIKNNCRQAERIEQTHTEFPQAWFLPTWPNDLFHEKKWKSEKYKACVRLPGKPAEDSEILCGDCQFSLTIILASTPLKAHLQHKYKINFVPAFHCSNFIPVLSTYVAFRFLFGVLHVILMATNAFALTECVTVELTLIISRHIAHV